MRNIYKTLFFVMLVLLSCSEEQYEQATITFYPTLNAETLEPAAGTSGNPYTIELLTSRILAHETQVNIRIEGNGAGYGYSYTTFPPQLEPGIVTVTVPAGEKKTLFTFTPLNDGIVEFENYHYTFTIAQANASVKSIGQGVFNFTVVELPFFEEHFDECSGMPAGLREEIVPGAMAASVWACTNFGYPETTDGTKYSFEANGFNKGDGISNSYLIIEEPIDDPAISDVFVSARLYSRFTGAGAFNILYSTNYSGTGSPEAEGVTWSEFPGTAQSIPTAGSREWTDVSGTLSGLQGQKVYVAFQYKGGTNGSAANWRLDDVIVKAK
jgi:hypothetical protein